MSKQLIRVLVFIEVVNIYSFHDELNICQKWRQKLFLKL